MCTADLKPPAVDNCSLFPVKQTVPGTVGDITPCQMAEGYSDITKMKVKVVKNKKEFGLETELMD